MKTITVKHSPLTKFKFKVKILREVTNTSATQKETKNRKKTYESNSNSRR